MSKNNSVSNNLVLHKYTVNNSYISSSSSLEQVRSLNIKRVLFQVIQFSMSTHYSTIWPIDWILSGATTPDQSGPRSDGIEVVLCIPQSSSIPETLPLDCFVSYTGHSLGGVSQCILLSVYSTAPANLVINSFCLGL